MAESAAGDRAGTLRYVIGTEVPVPGGAHETLEGMSATSPQAARLALEHNRRAFERHGVAGAWPRVVALVVQPDVEFDHLQVFDYRRERTAELRTVLADEPAMVFAAHSTDYQTVEGLAGLMEDHWAVLKGGPGLTFALREALFALTDIEDELLPARSRSRLSEVVDRRMRDEPSWWEGYYGGNADDQRLARRYSYSDRMRCYWPDPEIAAAQDRLFTNLSGLDIPLPLLSAHLPDQYQRVRTGDLSAAPRDLLVAHVRDVLRDYDRACRTHDKEYA
ncbi:class II D-tagatose-bisphosphate aldolase non-catalytic subunit [Streptomyces sp. NPDC059629]|uniref:class II D-tagatose-bisphosphate aldolase non-catalytic subunit n=1 Tax=Streptomyces sp. NPDC059629 TaxID=3346889 RepID=UPI0036B233C7